jgi:co-chaperonin GroES (HSP10)
MRVAPIYNNVLVAVDREWNDEIQGKNGIVGITFENDIERARGAVTKGVVVALPRATSNHYLLSRIRDKVLVGDTIYFHFNSIHEDTRVELSIEERPYYSVPMWSIFCVIRDGQIIMFGGRVLCHAKYDEDVVDEGGIKVKKTKSGIITNINVTHNLKEAVLRHIGNPLAGQPILPVKSGDTIMYDTDADMEFEVEGHKYLCMTQEDLLMKQA